MKGLGPLELLLGQLLGGLGLFQVGLGDAQVGLGLDDLLLVLFVLENGHELAAGQPVPDVDVELLDPAGDLRDDGEIGLGDERPREGADVPDAAAARRPRSRRRPRLRAARRPDRRPEPATICQTRKTRKRTARTVNGRAFFAQSRSFSFFQSILGKANLTIR